MVKNALYKLQCVTDNPIFEGFAFKQNKSLRGEGRLVWDFGTDNIQTKGRAWSVPPLAPIWKPQPVIGRVRTFNDYPCVNLTIPAFSHRAVEVLRDLLEPNGELLPLVSDVGEYFAYNLTKVADILDPSRSEINWNANRITASQIMRYVCFQERMEGLSIFQLVENPGIVYVTQVFQDRVNEHDLQGFHFNKVWSAEEDGSLQQLDKKPKEREKESKLGIDPAILKGNTVVLLLPIARAKPGKSEQAKLAKILDELDKVLYNAHATPNTSYFGNLEGNDYHESQIRIFLSCPNADILVDKIRPLLSALSWKRKIEVLKRYGALVNANCREEYVEL
jgi:hypothetical protein